METIFSKDKILNSVLSPYDGYCMGYPGAGNYVTALVMGAGVFKKTFSHAGSNTLDAIVAYDRSEIVDAYIGQINMIMVSSFCGPHGLIWGHDIAREGSAGIATLLSPDKCREFDGVEIKNGRNLRVAGRSLFGTLKNKKFPFLPGCHVPCAGRFYTKNGPAFLYGLVAIGIPADREGAACLFMEDAGEIAGATGNFEAVRERILLNSIRSVLQIGKDQGITYKEIYVDFISKEIKADEIGCILVAIPYLLLAKKAFASNLPRMTLKEWEANDELG